MPLSMTDDIRQDLEVLRRFHNHLGPFAVVGWRMGSIANQYLGERGFDKQALVFTGTKTPLSCIIDGIQFASGCTLGKGNISVEDKGEAAALFTSKKEPSKSIRITAKQDIWDIMESNSEGEAVEIVLGFQDEELFHIEKQ